MKILVEMGETEYRLTGGGEEGPTVPYGLPAALMIGADVYYACIVDPDATVTEVMRVDSVSPVDEVEMDDVTFGDDEEDEETDDPDQDPDGDDDDDDDDDIVDVEAQPVEEPQT